MLSGSAAVLLLLGLGRVLTVEDEEEMHTMHGIATASARAEVMLVSDLGQVLRTAPQTVTVDRPQWIRHRVQPRERVTQIAARYGVSASDVIEWNKLDPSTIHPKGRRTLQILARRIPPPRRQVRYVVGEGEGWMDIATKFGIERKDLRAYNWRVRRLTPGTELELWVDPGLPRTIASTWSASQSPARPPIAVPAGGQSVGRPQRGRLIDAVQLPQSDLYARKHPSVLWGSTHTIEQILRAFATLRTQTGYDGEIVIGAISRKSGRRFAPHVSHQSGRDIDIRLPLLPGVPTTVRPNPDEVDWLATWALVKAFVQTGEVTAIFLEIDLQSRLYEAARSLGETPETLRPIIAWPNWKENTRPIVRHSSGHDGHIHVRIRCGPAEPKCKGN
jgi:murein endopeptidase